MHFTILFDFFHKFFFSSVFSLFEADNFGEKSAFDCLCKRRKREKRRKKIVQFRSQKFIVFVGLFLVVALFMCDCCERVVQEKTSKIRQINTDERNQTKNKKKNKQKIQFEIFHKKKKKNTEKIRWSER